MSALPTSSQLEALRAYDSTTLANAIESFGVRLRNEGYTDSSLKCLLPRPAPMVGYAVTVRMKSSNPPANSPKYMDRTDWWQYIQSWPVPHIVVIEDIDEWPCAGSVVGQIHAAIWSAMGCIGVVTNGAVRDVPAIRATDFHLYAAGMVPSHGFSHIVDFGRDVSIAGLTIRSGDLLHGDIHGLVNIPLDIVDRLPAAADSVLQHEQRILQLCASPDFTPEKLTKLL